MVPDRINGHRIISARMRGLTLAVFLFLSPVLVAQNYFFDNYSENYYRNINILFRNFFFN